MTMKGEKDDLAAVRREDIESLAEKLDALALTMSIGERAALARVILNASTAARTERVPDFSGPLASSLAVGANFTPAGQGKPVAPIAPGELHSKERVLFRGVTP